MKRALAVVFIGAVAAGVAACGGGGGGGGGSSSSTPPPAPSAVAPSITAQPTDADVKEGQTAQFTVAATGTAPLSYQWSKNGTAIAGANASSYTTAPATRDDDGAQFVVAVANSAGSATSNTAKLSVTSVPSPATAYDVTTFKNDTARTGQYLAETTLTPANVNASTFGLLGLMAVDGKVDAQPLYLGQLPVAGANHNVVFVATEHDSVYAFDADTRTILWQVSLLAPGETPSDDFGCDTIIGEIGVTSTPVIDRTAGPDGTLYVVSMSIDKSSNYHQRLHALDVATGAEQLNGPVDIAGSYTNASGTTTFDPSRYEDRAALLLAGGTIYTSWSSHCDLPPYGGWIIAFNQTSLLQSGALNVGPGSATSCPSGNCPSTVGPAIWMSGSGPSVDAMGNVYLLTANGPFETTINVAGFPNGGDFGNSFLKIATGGGTLSVADYFTMWNVASETPQDLDLGSGGQLLLPDLTDGTGTVRHLVVGAGKDGNIYVVSRDRMGEYSPNGDNIWQELGGALGPDGIWGSPAYFNNTVYYGQKKDTLKAFTISNALLSSSPTSQSATVFGYPGTSPVVSANGASNAIVWAHETATAAVLHAYDASNLAKELYNSTLAPGSRDQFGAANTFIVPVVANGKVFVGTKSAVAEFGLLPSGNGTASRAHSAKPSRHH
jgi:Immunoglobulin I-set domain